MKEKSEKDSDINFNVIYVHVNSQDEKITSKKRIALYNKTKLIYETRTAK